MFYPNLTIIKYIPPHTVSCDSHQLVHGHIFSAETCIDELVRVRSSTVIDLHIGQCPFEASSLSVHWHQSLIGRQTTRLSLLLMQLCRLAVAPHFTQSINIK